VSRWIREWAPVIALAIAFFMGPVAAAVRRWGWPRPHSWVMMAACVVFLIDLAYLMFRADAADIRVAISIEDATLEYRSLGGGSGQFGTANDRAFCGQVEVMPRVFEFRLLIGDSPYADDWLTVVISNPSDRKDLRLGFEGSTDDFVVKISGRQGPRSFILPDHLTGSFHIDRDLRAGNMRLHWTPTEELLLEFRCDNPSIVSASGYP
jgi:hypothetical protein